jgi:predicted DCC family thiol-disulfide oxidoreductase YuxK
MTQQAPESAGPSVVAPTLLFNDECAVCRRLAGWVRRSAEKSASGAKVLVRPIGDDPDALAQLAAKLDIWEAYATIHLVMPDGSMKLGGEAVAEVLRRLPNCRWFAWSFDVGILGVRPFQWLLDAGYAFLAAVRPLLGCESCGIPGRGVRLVRSVLRALRLQSPGKGRRKWAPHFTAKPARLPKVGALAGAAQDLPGG